MATTVQGSNAMAAKQNVCARLDLQNLPESASFVDNIDFRDSEGIMLWVCLGVAIFADGVCVEGIVYLCRHIRSWSMRVQSAWQMAIFGIFASGSLFAMVIPRSSSNIDNVLSFFFALCQYELLNLFIDTYLKGENEIISLYGNSRAIDMTKVQPCMKCCKCLPNVKISRVSIQRIRGLVYQSTLIHALNLIVTIILTDDDKLTSFGGRGTFSAAPVLTLLTSISKIVATFGLYMVNQIFPEDLQEAYKTRQKIQVFNGLLVFSQLQMFLLQILLGAGIITCNPALGLSAGGRASYIHHACLTFEMLLMCLLARILIWRSLVPEPEVEIALKAVTEKDNTDIPVGNTEK